MLFTLLKKMNVSSSLCCRVFYRLCWWKCLGGLVVPPISQTLRNEVMSPTWAECSSTSDAPIMKLSSTTRWSWSVVCECVGSTSPRWLILYQNWTPQHQQPPKGGGGGGGGGGASSLTTSAVSNEPLGRRDKLLGPQDELEGRRIQ